MENYPKFMEEAIPLLVAALGGLLVGIEREWSARIDGHTERFAGVRTFLLIGISGVLGVFLMKHGAVIAGGALMAGITLLIVCAYFVSAYRGRIDATTEVAALLVFGAGAFAGMGQLTLASGINALTALVLVEKTRIHGLVYRLQSLELEAAARFAVMALVILPLLPIGPYGPAPGFRPRSLWIMVLIFSGLNFAGYIARRTIGPERGYRLAGLLGGLISSTGVTLTYARESRRQETIGRALAYGVIGACTILLARVPAVLMIFNPSMALAVIPYMAIPFMTGAVLFLVSRRQPTISGELPPPPNPLDLKSAMLMATLFQAGLYLLAFEAQQFGDTGILVTAALLGLMDMDALTFAMISLGTDPQQAPIAGQAIAVGVLSNTALKTILAASIGKGQFRRTAGVSLAILTAACAAGLLVLLIR